MTTLATRVLRELVSGDVTALPRAERLRHEDLEAAASDSALVITGATVAAVLRRYMGGAISADLAQRWASFVRWGHLPGSSGLIHPLDIDYEPAYEDAIVEAIARLDELGDLIDGEISPAEAEELLRHLR